MRIRNTIGWLLIGGLLMFSNMVFGKQITEPTASHFSLSQSDISHFEKLGVPTECYAIALPTLSIPLPAYHFLTHTYHFDTYKKCIFSRERFFISAFLRNVIYVFVSIHAP